MVTPNIFNIDLWKTSGHADHYKEHMFFVEVEKQEFGLKPMNCPGAPAHGLDACATVSLSHPKLSSPCCFNFNESLEVGKKFLAI